MNASCPRCGGTIFEPEALCPECLKRVALQESAALGETQPADLADELLPQSVQRRPVQLVSRSPSASDAGAERFGDYELLDSIGRGAMGAAFKARHVRLNRLVALKRIRQGRSASAAERARFLREAEAVARLQHPHIVTLSEAVVTDPGSVWTNAEELVIGDSGSGNRLVVNDGGQVANCSGSMGEIFADSGNNLAFVTGPLRSGTTPPSCASVISARRTGWW